MLKESEVSEKDYETIDKLLTRATGITEEEKTELRYSRNRGKKIKLYRTDEIHLIRYGKGFLRWMGMILSDLVICLGMI